MNIGLIVEGHGEGEAVPILVRRVARWLDPSLDVRVVTPFRLPKGKMLKEAELRRTVELVARKAGPSAPILLVVDADDDAACQLGPGLLSVASAARSDRELAVVVAIREYEAWLLASAESLAGLRGLPGDLPHVDDPEGHANPKAWLDVQMPEGYSETLDQPALTAAIDLALARRCDSFDKFVRDLARLLGRSTPPRRLPEHGPATS